MSNTSRFFAFARRLRLLPLIVLTTSALATSVEGCMGTTHDEGTTDSRLTDGYGGYDGYGDDGYGGYSGYGDDGCRGYHGYRNGGHDGYGFFADGGYGYGGDPCCYGYGNCGGHAP